MISNVCWAMLRQCSFQNCGVMTTDGHEDHTEAMQLEVLKKAATYQKPRLRPQLQLEQRAGGVFSALPSLGALLPRFLQGQAGPKCGQGSQQEALTPQANGCPADAGPSDAVGSQQSTASIQWERMPKVRWEECLAAWIYWHGLRSHPHLATSATRSGTQSQGADAAQS